MSQPPNEVKVGAKWDNGKCDWSYLPSEAVEQVLKVYAGGAKKYGRGNYLNGISFSRVFSAAMRHLWAWWRLEDKDEESGLSHLAHACWNVLTLLEYVLREKEFSKFDDRCAHEPLIQALQQGLKDIEETGHDPSGTLRICDNKKQCCCQHEWIQLSTRAVANGVIAHWKCQQCYLERETIEQLEHPEELADPEMHM